MIGLDDFVSASMRSTSARVVQTFKDLPHTLLGDRAPLVCIIEEERNLQ